MKADKGTKEEDPSEVKSAAQDAAVLQSESTVTGEGPITIATTHIEEVVAKSSINEHSEL